MPINDKSYISLADAEIFFNTYLYNSPWCLEETTDDMKERALITASSMLNDSYQFSGVKSEDAEGELEWPRDDAVNKCEGTDVESGIIPVLVLDATCIEANYLISRNQNPYTPSESTSKGIKEAKLDTMVVKYDLESMREADETGIVQASALKLDCLGAEKTVFSSFINGHTIRA